MRWTGPMRAASLGGHSASAMTGGEARLRVRLSDCGATAEKAGATALSWLSDIRTHLIREASVWRGIGFSYQLRFFLARCP